jgi:histidinol dehydrogenase
MTPEAHSNRNALEEIKARMLAGEITPDEAKAEAQPIIDAINARGAEIAKEYGRKFKKLTFAYLMR